MKRTTTIRIMVAVALVACANMAEAQWTQYRGANGSSWGSANRMGNIPTTTTRTARRLDRLSERAGNKESHAEDLRYY